MPAEAPNPYPGRDTLPDSITPTVNTTPDELELEAMASRPVHTKPDPNNPGLTQPRGWKSVESRKRSLANLRRRVPSMAKQKVKNPPPVPEPEEGKPPMPVPDVPMADNELSKMPSWETAEGRNVRLVLDKWEYDLYVEEWHRLWKGHTEDYKEESDRLDIHSICMEHVNQMRLLRFRKEGLGKWDPEEYHQSVMRMQRARNNLAATRSDRLANKKSQANQGGILAVLIGSADARVIEGRMAQHRQLQDEEAQFLESTRGGNVVKLIPSTVVQPQKEGESNG